MPKRETTLTFSVEEVEKALREALALPDHAHVHFEVEGQEDPADWQAAQPLDYVFVGITVSYEER